MGICRNGQNTELETKHLSIVMDEYLYTLNIRDNLKEGGLLKIHEEEKLMDIDKTHKKGVFREILDCLDTF